MNFDQRERAKKERRNMVVIWVIVVIVCVSLIVLPFLCEKVRREGMEKKIVFNGVRVTEEEPSEAEQEKIQKYLALMEKGQYTNNNE